MLSLDFWYIFIGVLFIVVGIFYFFQPKEAKKFMKGIARRIPTLRLIGLSYIFVATLMWWSAAFTEGIKATILLVFAYATLLKSLVYFFIPNWHRKNVLKKVLKWKDTIYRVLGLLVFTAGICSLLLVVLYS